MNKRKRKRPLTTYKKNILEKNDKLKAFPFSKSEKSKERVSGEENRLKYQESEKEDIQSPHNDREIPKKSDIWSVLGIVVMIILFFIPQHQDKVNRKKAEEQIMSTITNISNGTEIYYNTSNFIKGINEIQEIQKNNNIKNQFITDWTNAMLSYLGLENKDRLYVEHVIDQFETILSKYSDKDKSILSYINALIARCYIDKRYWIEATTFINKALELNSSNPTNWQYKCYIYTEQKKYSEALHCLDTALIISPNNTDILYAKGLVFTDMKMYDDAITYFNKVLELQPEFNQIYGPIGLVYLREKKYDRAIEYFDIDLSKKRNIYSLDYKAQALCYLKGYDEALKCISEAIDLAGRQKSYDFLNTKGKIFESMGRYQDALNCYNEALEIEPTHLDSQEGKTRMKKILNKK